MGRPGGGEHGRVCCLGAAGWTGAVGSRLAAAEWAAGVGGGSWVHWPAGGRVSGGTYAAGCAAPAPESSNYLSLVPGGPGPRACSRPGVGPGPGRHLRVFLASLRCKVPGRKTSVVMAVQST